MIRTKKLSPPPDFKLVSLLSTCLTVTVSVIYTVLSLLAIIYRYECSVSPEDIRGSKYFINVLFRVYIQKNECESSMALEGVTQADFVFTMTIITLCASLFCLISAIALMATIKSEEQDHLHMVAYLYVGVCCASLVVDLTFGTHFGVDFGYLTSELDPSNPGLGMNYERDSVRLGALFLMTVCLKGFVAHVVNIVLLVLIVVYMVEYQRRLAREQHPIHKLGPLSAYDQTRRPDPWHSEPQMMYRGPQINPAFVDDMSSPPRSPRREPSVAPDYTRSESWQAASRPFSYLEEGRRAANARAPPAEQWRRERDWPPPVPAPDYSPQGPRRLKSALKPSYT